MPHIVSVVVRTLSFVLLGVATSSLAAGPNKGLVFDYDTNEPIEGAYVATRWLGSRPISGTSTCDHVEVAVSDRSGTYEVRKWQPTLPVIPWVCRVCPGIQAGLRVCALAFQVSPKPKRSMDRRRSAPQQRVHRHIQE